jgi:hypothetical protein
VLAARAQSDMATWIAEHDLEGIPDQTNAAAMHT